MVKALIVLAPIPYGCVGAFWSPVFYLLLLLTGWQGLAIIARQQDSRQANRDSIPPTAVPGLKWMKRMLWLAFVFLIFQVIPLPWAVLRAVSPRTAETIALLRDTAPGFHPLSLIPWETVLFILHFAVVVLFIWILITIELRRRELRSLAVWMILSAALQAGFALLKFAGGNRHFFLLFRPLEADQAGGFLTGTLVNPNHFAFYLNLVIPLALALLVYRLRLFSGGASLPSRVLSLFGNNWKALFIIAALGLMFPALVLTGSRAAVVALGLMVMVFSLLLVVISRSLENRRRWVVLTLPLLVLGVLYGAGTTVDKFLKIPDKLVEGRGIGRLVRWPATLDMVADFPLAGVGFGTYRFSYFLYDSEANQWVTHAHSDLLETFAEGGILGGILFLAPLGMFLALITKRWWRRRRRFARLVGLGVIVAIGGALFHSLFDFALRIPANQLFFALLLGLGWQVVHYRSTLEKTQ